MQVLSPHPPVVRDLLIQRLRSIPPDTSEKILCTYGTRDHLLQEVTAWALAPALESQDTFGRKNVFWLHGTTGCGKSTVANTVAAFFDDLGRLGTFLSFSRDDSRTSSPSDVIRTIAARLAMADARFSMALTDAINDPPEGSLADQFNKLLLVPFGNKDIRTTCPSEGPVVIVLDGLDQCGTSTTRAPLLSILGNRSKEFPTWLRIFITSRKEKDIDSAFKDCPNITDQSLDNVSVNRKDVELYLKDELRKIRTKNKHLSFEADWPSQDALAELLRRSGGVFTWAALACNLIDGFNPQSRLNTLLKGNPVSETTPEARLDDLYDTALDFVGDWKDEEFVRNYTALLSAVVVAEQPLTAEGIDELFQGEGLLPAAHTVDFLKCVLFVGQNKPIRIINLPFRDYVTNPSRCHKDPLRCIDSNKQQDRRCKFALRSLEQLNIHLERNHIAISAFRSRRDDKHHLSEGTEHAYRYWVEYLHTSTGDSGAFAKGIADLLTIEDRFKDWLNVVGLFWSKFVVLDLTSRLMTWSHVRRLDPIVLH